jgi:hypothetical protein
MVASAGFVVLRSLVHVDYYRALGIALLVVALRQICPRNSAIPQQALKLALALVLGNVLVVNVIPEKTVRAWISLSFERN